MPLQRLCLEVLASYPNLACRPPRRPRAEDDRRKGKGRSSSLGLREPTLATPVETSEAS